MTIDEEESGAVHVVTVTGRLDSTTAATLDGVLARSLEASAAVVIDFASVPYVSSSGLRVLLKAAKLARGSARRLLLAGVAPQVAEVFEISGCTRLFSIHADRPAALLAATA